MNVLRVNRATLWGLLVPLVAVFASFVVGGILIMLAGVDPVTAYRAFLHGAFGNRVNIGNTLSVASPLILCGLGIAFAGRCSVFNIGAEGQLLMGAALAVWVGLRFAGLPAYLLLPLIMLAGFVGGGLWGLVPGILKARYDINEVVLTVMLSEIAIHVASWLTRGPMLDPAGHGLPQSAALPKAGQLPLLLRGTRLHAGLLLALLAAVVVYYVLWKTTFGFKVRAVGHNARAAKYAGMSVASSIALAMGISGGLAGIAGAAEVAGVHYRLMDGISAGYGFTGIVVSLLGRRHPVGVVVSAILFAALQGGADAMQRRVAVPVHLAQVIQALTILFVLGGEYLRTHGLTGVRSLAARALGSRRRPNLVGEEDAA